MQRLCFGSLALASCNSLRVSVFFLEGCHLSGIYSPPTTFGNRGRG